ncbi:MAG: PEGA domain-containing protein, partial [Acidobacteriota bacterium]
PASRAPVRRAPEPPPAAGVDRAAPVGRLLLRSSPPGAEVRVDGEPRGITPIALHDLALGTRTVRVTLEGYQPYERRIVFSAARPSRAVEVQLAPTRAAPAAAGAVASPGAARSAPSATAAVTFETRPAGATVLLDGSRVGVTPLVLPSVTPGRHTVRFERAGYRPWTTTIAVRAGEPVRVAASLEGGQERE